MQAASLPKGEVWELPPVILHPFSDPEGPQKLVESSRAHLMLQGLLPSGELSQDEVLRRLLSGRLCELRMLFYVGKDLERWVDQCTELTGRDEVLKKAGISPGSFTHLLVEAPPVTVCEKLNKWGVGDYKAIFSRALGLNAIFSSAPDFESLSPDFIRYYYRFADQLYTCRQSLDNFVILPPENFIFELYASGEYSRLLEREWEEL